jgi:hypothetical protein
LQKKSYQMWIKQGKVATAHEQHGQGTEGLGWSFAGDFAVILNQ